MSKTLKVAVRSASAKTFAMWLMWPDAVMALAVTVFLGCVAFRQTHEIGLAGPAACASIGC